MEGTGESTKVVGKLTLSTETVVELGDLAPWQVEIYNTSTPDCDSPVPRSMTSIQCGCEVTGAR